MNDGSLEGRTVVVVGGSEGIGKAVASQCAQSGAAVVVTSRSADKAKRIAAELPGNATGETIDILDETSVRAVFAALGPIDHLVVSASEVHAGSLMEMPLGEADLTFRSKFFGPLLCVRSASIRAGGSVTLFSGILARKPTRGYGVLSSVNAAVEALGRSLALELAPVRVNTVSPGITRDTAAFGFVPADERESMFDNAGHRLPAGRVGLPAEIARGVLALMTNGFVTGTTLDIDGGVMLV